MIAIGKNIIIEIVEKEIKTESGLLLSAHDANDFRYKIGIVVVPGTEVSVIKEGDEIYYDKSHSYTMVINDKPYTIIQERDVVVVSSHKHSSL
jgi:co-chaperonin GroES (HSP10)